MRNLSRKGHDPLLQGGNCEEDCLGGRRTHLPRRGRYGGDLGRTSGFPVQAGHAHHPQHSIPFLYIFPRGVNSPHSGTIGLSTSISQERAPGYLRPAHLRLSASNGQAMKPVQIDAHLSADRAKDRRGGIVAFDPGLQRALFDLYLQHAQMFM